MYITIFVIPENEILNLSNMHGKNSFAKVSKNLASKNLDTDLKIILDYQNNCVKCSRWLLKC